MKEPQTTSTIDIEALASCQVLDRAGSPIRLGDLWSRHPAVLVFLRHFG